MISMIAVMIMITTNIARTADSPFHPLHLQVGQAAAGLDTLSVVISTLDILCVSRIKI